MEAGEYKRVTRPLRRSGFFLCWSTIVVALLLFPLLPAEAPAQQPASPEWKFDESQAPARWAAAESWGQLRAAHSASGMTAASTGSGGDSLFVLSVEFDSAASREKLNVPGVTVLTTFDRFAEYFVPGAGQIPDVAILQKIANSPGVRWFDWPEMVNVPPPAMPDRGERTREVPEETVRGGLAGLTGKGVIIAVIDTGIDFRHADFVTVDATGNPTSRLLYLWDTFDDSFDAGRGGTKPAYSYPNRRSFGTLYTREQLTADLRSTPPRIGVADPNGHGTAAAGVAAGNGRGSKGAHIGVAPDADLIGVRIGDARGAMSNGWMLNAIVAWLDSVARKENKPLVISCSFGGQYGPHDGSRVEERHLAARFADATQGRAIVISAGNSQRDGYHSRREFTGRARAGILIWRAHAAGSSIRLYVRGVRGGKIDLNQIRVAAAQVSGMPVVDVSKAVFEVNPLSGDLMVLLPVPMGMSAVFIWNESGVPTEVNAYGPPNRLHFDMPLRTAERIVGTPGTTSQAITVGSYAWNDQFEYQGEKTTLVDTCGSTMTIGQLSCYSSTGYVQGEVIKPDIVAPGEWYSAANAKKPDGNQLDGLNAFLDTSGNYRLFNGTSAAAPYAAGVIALMMQKKPTITVGEIKRLLRTHASSDAFTGRVPNPRWGNGKLNLAAVRSILNAVRPAGD